MFKKFIIIFLLYLQCASAQQRSLTVSGDLADTTGVGIVNCTVTLSGSRDGLIYSHFNIGNSNSFKVEINPGQNDSLIVEISHISFSSYRQKYAVEVGIHNLRLSITLHAAVQNLKQVNVTAPHIWKRGDTTFYKVNSFKEGDEKKLKDLLLKMPDFKLENNGQITYKNKPIDKITIDGEELFADKIELLLNNFPIHVLNTVQVIENQNGQRLLKGIVGGNKTFINLQINKNNSLSAGFGEIDGGVGTAGRYDFSPVAFSIYSKVKAGFVGNYNSIGNGVGLQQEGELRNIPEQSAQQLLMANNNIYQINNFEQRWYIKNRQWDNRLQVNAPLDKTTHSQTEISYVRDRQPQQVYNTSLLLNNGIYQQRIDSSNNLYKPAMLAFKQTLTITPDSMRELKIVFGLYNNQSIGQQSTIFRGFDINAPLVVATQNQWTSLTLSGDYTIRYSARKASTFSLLINKENLGQLASGESSDIAGIFSLPVGYNRMANQIQSGYTTIAGNWNLLMGNKKNQLTTLGFYLEHKEIALNQHLYVDQPGGNLPVVEENNLSNVSDYGVTKFNTSFTRAFKLGFSKPFLLSTDLGVAHFSPGSNDTVHTFNTFTYKAVVSHEYSILEQFTGSFSAGVYQEQLSPEKLYSDYYPASILSFNRYLNVTKPQQRLEGVYSIGHTLPDELTSFSILFTGSVMPSGVVSYNTYKSFIGFTDFYLADKSTSNKMIDFNASIPSLLLNAMIDFNASYGMHNYHILSDNELSGASLNYYTFFFSFKKNWNRKYFIRLSSIFVANTSHFPNSVNGATDKVSSLKNNFYQRLLINKQMNVVANFNLFYNNISTPNYARFVIADIEWNYQWKKTPLYLSLKGENLFNEKNYYNFNNSVLAQSFTTVPLIGRSLFASVRYTF